MKVTWHEAVHEWTEKRGGWHDTFPVIFLGRWSTAVHCVCLVCKASSMSFEIRLKKKPNNPYSSRGVESGLQRARNEPVS